MKYKGITGRIRAFIFAFLDSVETLEVLLLVFRNQTKTWSQRELRDALRSTDESVSHRIHTLQSNGFLHLVSSAGNSEYVYQSTSQDETIAELDQLYLTHRIRIIELIYSRPNDQILNFVDAFRFKKDAPKGDPFDG